MHQRELVRVVVQFEFSQDAGRRKNQGMTTKEKPAPKRKPKPEKKRTPREDVNQAAARVVREAIFKALRMTKTRRSSTSVVGREYGRIHLL